MPISTQTHCPQGWAPTSAGARDAQLGGNGTPRRQGARPEGGGVDEGLVIVLFTDVEGSTELSTGRGDAAARDLLRIHEELVRTQVAAHQGRIMGGRGDGFLVTFASARRALAGAVGIQRALEAHAAWAPHEHVRVRIGLNAGEVTGEQGELYGAAVNAAARICAQARGGEILAAAVVKELAGTLPGIAFADRGWTRLRGFPEDTHLHEVTWRREVPGGSDPPRTSLVGRDREMSMLDELAERALAGHGAMAMLGGEPGVGKTRLVEDLAGRAARQGMLVLIGHCQEMAGTPPHAPFVEIIEAATRTVPAERLCQALGRDAAQVARIAPELHRFFPDIPPPVTLPAEHERRYLFNSVRDFFQRASLLRPLLLVLEDLHWSDESTLMLLCHLAETVGDMPVLILGTHRDVAEDVRHPLAGAVEVLVRRHRCHRIAVDRLSERGVAAMIRAITGQDPSDPVVAAIHGETEGNPFFVEEVVRYLVDEGRLVDTQGQLRPDVAIGDLEVPDRVRLVVGRRLARLGGDTRRVLTAAAVIGRGFGIDLLEAMSEVDGEAWLDAIDEAERARLIVPGDDVRSAGYRFAHELIRQTLVAEVSLPRRQRLHLRVAEAMLRIEAGGVRLQAAEIAHHLLHAGALADRRTTIHYLALAADRANAAAAFEEALHHVRTALDLLPDGDRSGRAPLLEKLAQALHSVGRWDEALDAWREASAVHAESGDVEAVGRVCAHMASQLNLSGRNAESLRVASHGLDALSEGSSPWRVRLLALRGSCLSQSGDHEAGVTLTSQAVDLAEELGGGLLGGALVARAAHHWAWGELSETVRIGIRGADICRATGHLGSLTHALGIVQLSLTTMGRLQEAAALREELQDLSSRSGRHGALFMAALGRFLAQAMSGDLEAAHGSAAGALAMCQRTCLSWVADGHVLLGVVAFWRGDWDTAVVEFQEADRQELSAGGLAGAATAFRVLIQGYEGDRAGVLATLEERRGSFSEPGRSRCLRAWTTLLALPEALTVVGAWSEAAAFYPIVREAVDMGATLRLYDTALVQMVAGQCAAAGEDWAVAEEHYRTALVQAEELPHRIARPEVRRWLARMLLRRGGRGDRDEARDLLVDAMDGYRRLGMPRHREMVRSLLQTGWERAGQRTGRGGFD
ncbi:MAG: hypothetical protein QOE72_571 [Chloroflexota bacterium]|nr:hypothetical protein [Chloroflexota bacterium]